MSSTNNHHGSSSWMKPVQEQPSTVQRLERVVHVVGLAVAAVATVVAGG
jgi:hypothetical protein